MSNIYEKIGVPTIINAKGPATRLSGGGDDRGGFQSHAGGDSVLHRYDRTPNYG